MRHTLSIALVLSWLAVAAVHGDPRPFTTQPWNVKGDLLILDVGSLRFQGNHPMFPAYEQDGCAAACLRTSGCNAWTYCNNKKEGCGSGCLAYTKQNPQLSVAADGNPTITSPAWRQLSSITGFGPWGVTSHCAYECGSNGVCKPGDRYPNGMCSLKRLADPAKPQYWSNNAAEGWVSGVWQPPAECRGISGRACTRCLASKGPAGCLSCAAKLFAAGKQAALVDAANDVDALLTPADGCAACFNSQPEPSKCVACLSGGGDCAACALTQPQGPGRLLDVPACIDCTAQHGSRFKDACVACAALGAQPQQLRHCMACLAAMAPLACDSTDYPAPCFNPAQRAASCATCADSAQNFDTCLACLKTQPLSENCGACAVLPAAKQAACYSCAKVSRTPGSGCAACLTYLSDQTQLQQCVGCLTSRATTLAGKQWCFGCQNWCPDFAGRAKCVACLGTKQEAYMSACACNP